MDRGPKNDSDMNVFMRRTGESSADPKISPISHFPLGADRRRDSTSNYTGSSSSDEVTFILSSLDSQLKLLVDCVEKHVGSVVESAGRSERLQGKSLFPQSQNFGSVHSLRHTMCQQANAVRTTLRHIENRAQDQMEGYRSGLLKNVGRENELRQRVNDLKQKLLEKGMKLEELEIPRDNDSKNNNTIDVFTREFEKDFRDLIASRDRLLQEISQMEEIDKLKKHRI